MLRTKVHTLDTVKQDEYIEFWARIPDPTCPDPSTQFEEPEAETRTADLALKRLVREFLSHLSH